MKKIFYYALCLCVGAMSLASCDKSKSNEPDSKTGSTSDGNGTMTGHDYVDMGLSVKWATCNVGATKPEEYGDYFAWGETTTKSDYSWSTYKYCNDSNSTLTKYNNWIDNGIVDNKTTLELTDDVARVNWGGNWRMPTDAEWAELCENCTWTWTTQNNVNGYMVTVTNGNSIFLPAAGFCDVARLDLPGYFGSYWSSSLYESYSCAAWYVYFSSNTVGRRAYSRHYGFSVRPVHP